MTDTNKPVRAFAPATVANVGPGYDCMGFALDGIGDAVQVEACEEPGIRLTVRGDEGMLPSEPEKNCASVVAAAMLEQVQSNFGLKMILGKGLPLGSGLGSSGASSAAAALAVNELLGGRFSLEELIGFAAQGEEVACSAAHIDNVAPALLGGFVLVRHAVETQAMSVTVPDWYVAVCHPDLELDTQKARSVVPRRVSIDGLVRNVSNGSSLMLGLLTEDLELFGQSLMSDAVVERARAKMIPNYDMVRRAALDSGAAGASISGAGPSVFAVAENRDTAETAGENMANIWRALGMETQVHVSRLGGRSAYLA